MINKDELNHIYPEEFLTLLNDPQTIIIDIREPHELYDLPFKKGVNIPLHTLLHNFQDLLDINKTYYILCHHGQRSYMVTDFLHNKGYTVVNVVGGIDLVNRFDSLNNE